MKKPKRKPMKNRCLGIRLPKADYAELTAIAADRKMSLSALVREWLTKCREKYPL